MAKFKKGDLVANKENKSVRYEVIQEGIESFDDVEAIDVRLFDNNLVGFTPIIQFSQNDLMLVGDVLSESKRRKQLAGILNENFDQEDNLIKMEAFKKEDDSVIMAQGITEGDEVIELDEVEFDGEPEMSVEEELGIEFEDNHAIYNGVLIQKIMPSGMYEIYSDEKGRFLKFDDLNDVVSTIDSWGDEELEENKETSTSGESAPIDAVVAVGKPTSNYNESMRMEIRKIVGELLK